VMHVIRADEQFELGEFSLDRGVKRSRISL
jgi:hypothetical protein